MPAGPPEEGVAPADVDVPLVCGSLLPACAWWWWPFVSCPVGVLCGRLLGLAWGVAWPDRAASMRASSSLTSLQLNNCLALIENFAAFARSPSFKALEAIEMHCERKRDDTISPIAEHADG